VVSKNTESNSIYKGNPAIKHSLSAKTFFSINE